MSSVAFRWMLWGFKLPAIAQQRKLGPICPSLSVWLRTSTPAPVASCHATTLELASRQFCSPHCTLGMSIQQFDVDTLPAMREEEGEMEQQPEIFPGPWPGKPKLPALSCLAPRSVAVVQSIKAFRLKAKVNYTTASQ
ncbi:hypothetical protein LY76DRAFT_282540 [Colletotrichum caudatum]|nr:hypothetical protein LY76DRAFT_282540 [Colletotrichum caudatum]